WALTSFGQALDRHVDGNAQPLGRERQLVELVAAAWIDFRNAQFAGLAERYFLGRRGEVLQPADDREAHEQHRDHERTQDHEQLPDAHDVERDVPERARGQLHADDPGDLAFLEPESVLRAVADLDVVGRGRGVAMARDAR